MLKVSNLNVNYGAVHALKDVSLEVDDGELVTLIGANGAGKTTTLHAISGLLDVASGSIELDGENLRKIPAGKIIGRGLAHVPEGRHVFSQMTVLENLYMGAYSLKDRDRIEKNTEMVFKHFPRLKERSGQLAGTLSGGEQQMLATGRALMTNPAWAAHGQRLLATSIFYWPPAALHLLGARWRRVREWSNHYRYRAGVLLTRGSSAVRARIGRIRPLLGRLMGRGAK